MKRLFTQDNTDAKQEARDAVDWLTSAIEGVSDGARTAARELAQSQIIEAMKGIPIDREAFARNVVLLTVAGQPVRAKRLIAVIDDVTPRIWFCVVVNIVCFPAILLARLFRMGMGRG